MSREHLALLIGSFTGFAVVGLAEGGLFLPSAGYLVAGSALLSAGVIFALGALWARRLFWRQP